MFQLYSKTNSKLFSKSFLKTQKYTLYLSKQFAYNGYRYFGLKHSDNQEKPEKVIISEEELIKSQFLKDKTFFERNKLTFGMFGTGIVSSLFGTFIYFMFNKLGFPFLSTILYGASFGNLFRAEKCGLKLRKFYEDMKGINSQKYENLNSFFFLFLEKTFLSLLKDLMLKNPELSNHLRKETLCFSNMYLQRKSHAENRSTVITSD